MTVNNDISVSSENTKNTESPLVVPLLTPERTMEIVLQALGELIEYELAVVLSLEDYKQLRVRKAVGPLYTPRLEGYTIPLSHRRDLQEILEQKEPHLFDESTDHLDTYYDILNLPEGHSCLVAPLYVESQPVGLLTLDHRQCGKFTPGIVRFVRTISKLISVSMVQSDTSRVFYSKVQNLLHERNRLLQGNTDIFKDLVGSSTAWQRVLDMIRLVAATDVPVLLLGETGTGKEQVARKIHQLSAVADGPFVAMNCSALAPTLAESELFGHEKGAFSGAVAQRRGRFEMAHGGSLFLDEVGDLPLELQPKLLRVLQEGTFERLGGERTISVKVRIIAATNVSLEKALAEGRFREDLYYRLNVFPIILPPLRERDQDAVLLADYFVSLIRKRTGFEKLRLSPDALEYILAQSWPGNVRQLRNAIERAAILARGGLIEPLHLSVENPSVFPARFSKEREAHGNPASLTGKKEPISFGADLGPGKGGPQETSDNPSVLPTPSYEPKTVSPLDEALRAHILQALKASGGKIYGKGGAAELLGLKPSTLQSKMKKLGIHTYEIKHRL
ncbi:MAG: sigma 54-interacting transcriptional regulator [Breznakiellaceae bacterium]